MSENINIALILKDSLKGIKLYSPLYGEVEFNKLCTDNETIEVFVSDTFKYFDYYGRAIWHDNSETMLIGAECLLFPSKNNHDWIKFKAEYSHNHFNPYQKVLIASGVSELWEPDMYGYYDDKRKRHICMIHSAFDNDIIPYKGNENLVGKSSRKIGRIIT